MDLYTTTQGQVAILAAATGAAGQIGGVEAKLSRLSLPYSRSVTATPFDDTQCDFGGYQPVSYPALPPITFQADGTAQMIFGPAQYFTSVGQKQIDQITIPEIDRGDTVLWTVYGSQYPPQGSTSSFSTIQALNPDESAKAIAAKINSLPQFTFLFTASGADGVITLTHNDPTFNDPTFKMFYQYPGTFGRTPTVESVSVQLGSPPPSVEQTAASLYLVNATSNVLYGWGNLTPPLVFNAPGLALSSSPVLVWGC